MDFFQKLCGGEYAPINVETPDTKEYRFHSHIMAEAEEKLRATLTQEQLK